MSRYTTRKLVDEWKKIIPQVEFDENFIKSKNTKIFTNIKLAQVSNKRNINFR
ncbi:MAG: hypothetical protein HC815_19480 [Richelia sp. RM1_1_1]|nr:hypothetical protein [Richelia sp. RM1_1_1]